MNIARVDQMAEWLGPFSERALHLDCRIRPRQAPVKGAQAHAKLACQLGAGIATVLCYQALETRPGHEIHDLRKQRPANIHRSAPGWKKRDKYCKISTRDQIGPKPNRH